MGAVRLEGGKYGIWPSKCVPISKIRPSGGCGRDAVPVAVLRWYDFPGFGGYLLLWTAPDGIKRARMRSL